MKNYWEFLGKYLRFLTVLILIFNNSYSFLREIDDTLPFLVHTYDSLSQILSNYYAGTVFFLTDFIEAMIALPEQRCFIYAGTVLKSTIYITINRWLHDISFGFDTCLVNCHFWRSLGVKSSARSAKNWSTRAGLCLCRFSKAISIEPRPQKNDNWKMRQQEKTAIAWRLWPNSSAIEKSKPGKKPVSLQHIIKFFCILSI